jgi:protein disulfide-isomerase A1
MARQSLPTISAITADSLQGLKKTSNVIVVGYFAHDDKFSYEAFTSVAEALHEDYVFGITNDDALAKSERINIPSIALYKSFGSGKNVFGGTHDSQAISAFVKVESTCLVVEFHPELYFSYVDVGLENP